MRLPCLIATAVMLFPPLSYGGSSYVGSSKCEPCHRETFRLWASSLHAWAMKPARKPLALAPFDGKKRELAKNLKLIPTRKKEQLWLELPGATGIPESFLLTYFLGHGSLEQYLSPFPGGRLQALPVGYDPRKKDWFDIFAGEERKPSHWGYWTNRGMTANYQCLYCHTTDYTKGYNQERDDYDTRWSEIAVGCEACHGPGTGHLENAGGEDDPYSKMNVRQLVPGLCAPCHSRRAEIAEGYLPGRKFLDYFDPELLETEAYYPDGQIKEEDYEWTSFVQGTMYQRGVTCLGCHDPHAAKLKASGNALCLRCHAAKLAGKAHTHHKPSSPGNQCVSCHMPETVYMQRDWRRDHSFPVPDPKATKLLGIPNACSRCHTDKTLEWISASFDSWYPEARLAKRRSLAEAFGKAREREAGSEKALIGILQSDLDRIRRASAARLLASFVRNQEVTSALSKAASDSDPLVRAAAVGSLAEVPKAVPLLLNALEDSVRLVRIRAAFGLRKSHVPEGRQGKLLESAFKEWEEAQMAMADFPTAQHNLGTFYTARGNFTKAAAAYRRAIQFDPDAVAPRHNLAMLLASVGRNEEAEREFGEILARRPDSPASAFSLGLLYGQTAQWSKAVAAFEKCLKYEPDYPRARYNLGLALAKAGRLAEAIQALKEASRSESSNRSAAAALSSIFSQLGRTSEAEEWTKKAKGLEGRE